jgi:hypothetical protein
MIKEGFFPTLIYAEDFKLDTNQIAQNIVQWSKEDEGVTKTNVNVVIINLMYILMLYLVVCIM